MKMENTECSEKSVYKIQTPGNYPEESMQYIFHYLERFYDLSVIYYSKNTAVEQVHEVGELTL